ncbi:MAG: helix-turn-helix transcriptional regulator [Bacteroidales bacterium]|nr:helix-turn-helix transcriptional regulator [Bacteroidales bacterium]
MPRLFIKNMVCDRCIMAVAQLLSRIGITASSITLGEVVLEQEPTSGQMEDIAHGLKDLGFELIDDKKSRIIEKIKTVIIEHVHYRQNGAKWNISDIISHELHHDYGYLSNLFSEVEGTTIEKYYIAQKIEKVKELLVYDELSLSEIAFRLNYSSAAYLSNQFKKITGLTPGHFRKIGRSKRKPLDKV